MGGRVEEDSSRQVQALQERLQQEAKEKLEKELDLVSRERSKCETKVGQLVSKVGKLGGELEEERQLNKSLRENQDEWQTRLKKAEVEVAVLQKTKDREILELQEQVRDLMFFMEAQSKVKESPLKDEIQGGSITVGDAPPPKQ